MGIDRISGSERRRLLKELLKEKDGSGKKDRRIEIPRDSDYGESDETSDLEDESTATENSSDSSIDERFEHEVVPKTKTKSLSDGLVDDKLRMDIMSRDYVNICTQIHTISKSINCGRSEKTKMATLVYYYIKYFLYSCSIQKKPIFDWLEEFKDKIHIY